jgi:hypothetical protein
MIPQHIPYRKTVSVVLAGLGFANMFEALLAMHFRLPYETNYAMAVWLSYVLAPVLAWGDTIAFQRPAFMVRVLITVVAAEAIMGCWDARMQGLPMLLLVITHLVCMAHDVKNIAIAWCMDYKHHVEWVDGFIANRTQN